ncbi:lopap-like [Bacillus rossius redtenbacheri]|uniref:lopap-like n=1 Tax=Bacillus rossius redtenbacheri TaxID=93214 RepID=UPI002FDCF57D
MAPPAALTVLLLAAVTAIGDSTCPDREALGGFDSSAFLGRWYVVKQTTINSNASIECLSILVKPAGELPGRLATHTRFVDRAHVATHVTLGVLFKEDNSSTNGKYLYSRRMSATESDKKYYILGTDYTNYAVTWYCFPSAVTGQVEEILTLLSRRPGLDPGLEARLPEGDYTAVAHDGCGGPGASPEGA